MATSDISESLLDQRADKLTERQTRLATALRSNIARRKAQAAQRSGRRGAAEPDVAAIAAPACDRAPSSTD
jgi:uncharacterized small protein (DUF1192 family)